MLVLATSLSWVLYFRSQASAKIRSVAVLPVESLSPDASQDYFADGMTDELMTDLGQISALRVISRTSVMTYKHVHKPLPEIARELDVDAMVEGTVLRSGGRVRITAQLIRVPVEQHIWAQSFEGDLRDTLVLQKSIARSIAEQIQATLNRHEQAALAHSKVVNPEAYEAYLKGRYFWNKRTGEGLKKAIEYFKLAIEKNPKYAEAYTGLGDAYALSTPLIGAPWPGHINRLRRRRGAEIRSVPREFGSLNLYGQRHFPTTSTVNWFPRCAGTPGSGVHHGRSSTRRVCVI